MGSVEPLPHSLTPVKHARLGEKPRSWGPGPGRWTGLSFSASRKQRAKILRFPMSMAKDTSETGVLVLAFISVYFSFLCHPGNWNQGTGLRAGPFCKCDLPDKKAG